MNCNIHRKFFYIIYNTFMSSKSQTLTITHARHVFNLLIISQVLDYGFQFFKSVNAIVQWQNVQWSAVKYTQLQLHYSKPLSSAAPAATLHATFQCDLSVAWWLSRRAFDLRFTGCRLNSRPVRFHITQVNSALHPSGVAKSSTCFYWG